MKFKPKKVMKKKQKIIIKVIHYYFCRDSLYEFVSE